MIVRPMQVHEAIAEFLQDGQCCRAPVDELPIRSTCAEDALDQKLSVLAWLDPLILQLGVQSVRILHFENRFHRATVRAGANQRFIGSFAEHELQRTDNDGLTGTGLAGDGCGPGTKGPFQLVDEREVANTQG